MAQRFPYARQKHGHLTFGAASAWLEPPAGRWPLAAAARLPRSSIMVATTEQDVEVANEMSQSAKFVFDTAG
jgi:hypothetical protein